MFDRRSKVVMDDEQKHWEHINPSCMTEESDDDGGEKIVTHKLQWRSPGIYTIDNGLCVMCVYSLRGVCEDSGHTLGQAEEGWKHEWGAQRKSGWDTIRVRKVTSEHLFQYFLQVTAPSWPARLAYQTRLQAHGWAPHPCQLDEHLWYCY